MSAALSMQRATWIDALNTRELLAIASALGLEVLEGRGASGGSFACPSCNATTRHESRKDRRLAVGVLGNGEGWRCFGCQTAGDRLHLVAYVLAGRRFNECGQTEKDAVRAWVQDFVGEVPQAAIERAHAARAQRAAEPPKYPGVDVVCSFMKSATVNVDQEKRAVEWLTSDRGLDPAAVADARAAWVLRYGAPCPEWATVGSDDKERPWSKTLYRCLFPLYDATGTPRSVLTRYMGTPKYENAPKSRAANGYQRTGLVVADRNGQQLLAGKLEHGERELLVVLAEGEMDLLAFASMPTKSARAVLGIFNGSWTNEHAARIPDGARVLVAVHHDEEGDRYAYRIGASLAERGRAGALRVERWKEPA